MRYQFYHNGELSKPQTLDELRGAIDDSELVKDESGTWLVASEIPGWGADVISDSNDAKPGTINPEVLYEQPVKGSQVETPVHNNKPSAENQSDEFEYYSASRFWKYFSYGDEYISGGTYLVRVVLQGLLLQLFGLGFYLQLVTAYKRLRSLGTNKEGAGFLVAMYAIATVVLFGLSLKPYPSDEEAIIITLFFLFCIVLHWWLILANSKDAMMGGPKALLHRLEVSSLERRSELIDLLNREQILRNNYTIPADVAVVPVLIPNQSKQEYKSTFGTSTYYLAVRDSKRYYALPELTNVKDERKLNRRTPEFEEQYREFKSLIAFK